MNTSEVDHQRYFFEVLGRVAFRVVRVEERGPEVQLLFYFIYSKMLTPNSSRSFETLPDIFLLFKNSDYDIVTKLNKKGSL